MPQPNGDHPGAALAAA
ncbi:hypothetical protein [Litorivivens sp.]